MKKIPALLLAAALAMPTFAQDAAKKTSPSPGAATDASPVIPASAAKLTAPLVLKDGAINHLQLTDLADGGKAIFDFTVPKDGTYVIHAVVNAAGEEENSFFLNIDAAPQDPLMIWDIDVTTGFQERVVSWRGNGDGSNDEFTPKKFTLTAGAHELYLVGREPAALKSFSVRPAK
jgi:hypothetical protein